ncbi:MAG TPA: hypothetical protein VF587_11495, partial [Solirubrobacteraceae bacterium]
EPAGVMKQSFVSGLYATGNTSGWYSPPGVDQSADLNGWYTRISAGEPYDGEPVVEGIANTIYDFKSSIAITREREPAPTLVANGWTDDLFPVDEAIRMYRVFRSEFPTVPFAMMHFDFGHQRGAGKDADEARYRAHVVDWMDRYVKGDTAVTPLTGVETLTQTCPGDAPSGGPFNAPTWDALHPGEVRLSDPTQKTFTSAGGDPSVAQKFDPIAGSMNNPCTSTSGDDEPDTANWRLPPAAGEGFTLMGSPSVEFDMTMTGEFPEIVARLLDVAPDGTQTLVARGIYRPGPEPRQIFQLHPNGWHFAAEHVPKLQLLGRDVPYARASNGQFQIAVSNLEFRMPVLEAPGTVPQVEAPGPLVLRPGDTPAPGVGPTRLIVPPARAGSKRTKPRVRLVVGCRRARLRGRDVGNVARLVVRKRGMRRKVDRSRPFSVRLRAPRRSRRVRAVAVMRGGKRVKLTRAMPRACARRRR